MAKKNVKKAVKKPIKSEKVENKDVYLGDPLVKAAKEEDEK